MLKLVVPVLSVIIAITVVTILINKSNNNSQLSETNSAKKNDLIDNRSKVKSSQENNPVALHNQKVKQNSNRQEARKTAEGITEQNNSKPTSPTKLKKLDVLSKSTYSNIKKWPNLKINDQKTPVSSTSNLGLNTKPITAKLLNSVQSDVDDKIIKTNDDATNQFNNHSSSESENIKTTDDKASEISSESEVTELSENGSQTDPIFSAIPSEGPSAKDMTTDNREAPLKADTDETSNMVNQLQPTEVALAPSLDSSRINEETFNQPVVADSSEVQQTFEDSVETGEANNDAPEIGEDVKIDSKGSKEKLWTIGFTFGPDFLEKQITANSDLLNFEQKQKEEIFDNTWGIDFEFGRYLTPWLSVGTGVGFKKYQEVNSYSSETFTTYDTSYTFIDNGMFVYDTIPIAVDSIGDTIYDIVEVWEEDTMTITNISSKTEIDSSKKVANGTVTSSYIQIPISAQLIFINSKKLTAYTNLGITIGLLTKNTGMMLDYQSNNIVTYTTRKMIYNANIGLGLNYTIFGPLDYKLYGGYQFSLSNFSLTPNIDKRYNGFSLRTGVVFHF